jgi:hypothetical protein
LENRRNARVPVNFDVEIEGQTSHGDAFCVDAKAELISCAGATLITDVMVERGAALRLTAPFGSVFEAEVNGIWMNEADGHQRLGIKLIRPPTWLSD